MEKQSQSKHCGIEEALGSSLRGGLYAYFHVIVGVGHGDGVHSFTIMRSDDPTQLRQMLRFLLRGHPLAKETEL
ncbi:hypothetical protein QYF36_019656 [Acer negundo]|nr:hypothetical protein QYF36_019656 [Acer negundo]